MVTRYQPTTRRAATVADDSEPTTPTMAPCFECHGTGTERVAMAGRWYVVDCLNCRGDGTLADDADVRGDDLAERCPDDHSRRSAMARPVGHAPICAGCGRRGVAINNKPLTVPVWCPACRPRPVPAPRPAPLGMDFDLAALAAIAA